MKIEIYLEMGKAIVKGNTPYGPSPTSARRRFGSQEESIFVVRESFTGLTESEIEMLETIERVAAAQGIEARIYDTSRFRDGLRAFFKGVRAVPAVIIGRTKIVGEVTESQLRNALGKA